MKLSEALLQLAHVPLRNQDKGIVMHGFEFLNAGYGSDLDVAVSVQYGAYGVGKRHTIYKKNVGPLYIEQRSSVE